MLHHRGQRRTAGQLTGIALRQGLQLGHRLRSHQHQRHIGALIMLPMEIAQGLLKRRLLDRESLPRTGLKRGKPMAIGQRLAQCGRH